MDPDSLRAIVTNVFPENGNFIFRRINVYSTDLERIKTFEGLFVEGVSHKFLAFERSLQELDSIELMNESTSIRDILREMQKYPFAEHVQESGLGALQSNVDMTTEDMTPSLYTGILDQIAQSLLDSSPESETVRSLGLRLLYSAAAKFHGPHRLPSLMAYYILLHSVEAELAFLKAKFLGASFKERVSRLKQIIQVRLITRIGGRQSNLSLGVSDMSFT